MVCSRDGVVITGIGPILPNTTSVATLWQNLRDGKSQLGFLPGNQEADLFKIGGKIENLDPTEFLPQFPARHASKYSREMLIVMAALTQACRDAGLTDGGVDPERAGFIDASSRGPLNYWYDSFQRDYIQLEMLYAGTFSQMLGYPDRDSTPPPPPGDERYGGLLQGLPGCAASLAAITLGLKGLVTTLSSACVSGNHALGIAAQEILRGAADVMYIGGHDFPLIPPLLGQHTSPWRQVHSKETENPKSSMKPYDIKRDGFALGEGSVVLCLERKEHAIRRGARIYAEVAGHANLNEAAHPTRMDVSGKSSARLVQRLLESSNTPLDRVSYFCGHGTATRYNDWAESRTLGHLYNGTPRARWSPLGSIKPVYGHLLGGAAILNTAASALMVHHQTLCPTINLTEPDPECDHDHVAEGPREADVDVIVSMAFAIGSQSAAAAVKRPD